MKLTAVFEEWHIPDCNYPAFAVGDEVRLAFQMDIPGDALNLVEERDTAREDFCHRGLGDYSFCAKLLRSYQQPTEIPLAIFETSGFTFYVEHTGVPGLQCGRHYSGLGTLLLDYYIWTEYLEDYENPPDLFLNLRVTRIRRVPIPERFIHRDGGCKSMPTRVAKSEVQERDIVYIEDIGVEKGDEQFYVLDLDGTGLEGKSIPTTFIRFK